MSNNVIYDDTTPSHQQTMLDACQVGDVSQLQQLFFKYGVKQGDDPVKESWILDLTAPSTGPKRYIHETAAQCGPPPTEKLFEAAALSKTPIMILFLLKTYPKYNFWDCGIMNMALTKDDLATFKEIYSHDTRGLTFSYDDDMTMAFHDAILAKFLSGTVDDPQDRANWLCRECNMSAVLLSGILLETIDKILDKSPDSVGLSCLIKCALRRGHVEILELFCDRGKLHLEALSDEEKARAIWIGRQWERHKLVAFLEDCLKQRGCLNQRQQECNTEKDSGVEGVERLSISVEETLDSKWWQCWK